MKEQDLVDLGFERTDVSEIESGGDPFHYYTLDFARGLSLISQASDEVIDNEWFVEFFETDPTIRFTVREHVEALIKIINKAQTNK